MFIHSLLSDPRYVDSIFISFEGIRVGNLSHPEIKAASICNVTHLLYVRILTRYLGNVIIPFVEILVYKYWTKPIPCDQLLALENAYNAGKSISTDEGRRRDRREDSIDSIALMPVFLNYTESEGRTLSPQE